MNKMLAVKLLAMFFVTNGLFFGYAAQSDPKGSGKKMNQKLTSSRDKVELEPRDNVNVTDDRMKARSDSLKSKASTHGSVRVIVRLKFIDWKPEGELPDQQAVRVQRDKIVRLQDALLKRMAPFAVKNVRKFKYAPQVAMEVDAAGLHDLSTNPDVADVREDAPVPPSF